MLSVKSIFTNIQIKNPGWPSWVCFTETIKQRDFAPKIVAKWFNILVEKEDYAKSEKKELLAYLNTLTKCPEEGIKSGVNEPGSVVKKEEIINITSQNKAL
ncbi:MAG: hypothetical protein KBC69_00470 [Candidatus Magasanikbacteria bacterium]|nr:hypothetical protein [Candidatus Magasanikbacteria bacterium]